MFNVIFIHVSLYQLYMIKICISHSHNKLFFSMRLHSSKRTKVWQPVNVLEPKEYAYIPELLVNVFQKRVDVQGSVTQRLVRSADDPRNIAPNIAAVPRPTLQEALQS
jgi:hypothetical protein